MTGRSLSHSAWPVLRRPVAGVEVGQFRQSLPIVGKRLADTGGVENSHARQPQAGERQAHGHPMVVVRGKRCRAERCGRDRHAIGDFPDRAAQFAEFAGQVADPVRLLVADSKQWRLENSDTMFSAD